MNEEKQPPRERCLESEILLKETFREIKINKFTIPTYSLTIGTWISEDLISDVLANYPLLFTSSDCMELFPSVGGKAQARLVISVIDEVFGDTEEKLQIADELKVAHEACFRGIHCSQAERDSDSSISSCTSLSSTDDENDDVSPLGLQKAVASADDRGKEDIQQAVEDEDETNEL